MKPLPVKTRPDHAGLWHQIIQDAAEGLAESGPYACERTAARTFVEWVRHNIPHALIGYRTDRAGGVWFSKLERKT